SRNGQISKRQPSAVDVSFVKQDPFLKDLLVAKAEKLARGNPPPFHIQEATHLPDVRLISSPELIRRDLCYEYFAQETHKLIQVESGAVSVRAETMRLS